MRRIAGIALAAAAAIVTITSSSAAGADGPARTDVESASSAIPGAPGATAQDESIRYRQVNARTVRADSVADGDIVLRRLHCVDSDAAIHLRAKCPDADRQ